MQRARWIAIVSAPLAVSCSALGLFDAAPATSCLVDADCRVPGLIEDPCTRFTCDLAARLCVGRLYDHDGDGQAAIGCSNSTYASTGTSTDCNDGDGSTWRGATEVCGGGDNDCDDIVDETCVVPQFAVGNLHSCYLAGPTLLCWGDNSHGEIGTGSAEVVGGHPRRVVEIEDAVEITAGYGDTCARRADGRVFCWGTNDVGQLALPAPSRRVTPTEVPSLEGATGIALGRDFGCALLDGEVVCWGANINGQLGDGTLDARAEPRAVVGLVEPIQVSAGNGTACAVLADGTVSCWGAVPMIMGCASPLLPCPVEGLTDATDVAVGGFHACARREGHPMACWGADNSYGQLGHPDADTRTWWPVVAIVEPSSLAAGGFHTCVISEGQAQCWGGDQLNQVGADVSDIVLSPARVQTDVADFREVRAGTAHTCALRSGGELLCWGDNRTGQLGVPGQVDSPMPQYPLRTWTADGRP